MCIWKSNRRHRVMSYTYNTLPVLRNTICHVLQNHQADTALGANHNVCHIAMVHGHHLLIIDAVDIMSNLVVENITLSCMIN